jgi:myosin-crossreactive antigen
LFCSEEIEKLLLERNYRHLQQAVVEEGRTHDPIIQSIMGNHGTDLLQEVKDGRITVDDATDKFIAAWLTALKQTPEEASLPSIVGEITTAAFQEAFKRVGERTSSAGIHYTLWKCLARDEEYADLMSKMMSLPFRHGFLNE